MAADGFDGLRAMRANAREVGGPPPEEEAPPPPEDEDPGPTLPGRCPVVPLGVQGDVVYYLDQLKQLRPLKAKDHSRLNVMALFGTLPERLYELWPRRSQNKNTGEWEVTGWKPELAAEAMMAAAARRGVWSPQDRVRGAGAWCGADGELILHCGNVLLMVPADRRQGIREEAPGVVDAMVYPAAPPIPRPHPVAQGAAEAGPAQELLDLLETWQWRRGEIDPYLLLGWIGAAMLGGALDWRPVAWITGGRGTGKSSLQDLLKWLMGSSGILQSADPTAAGIRQVLKYASLPVAVDEAEPEEGNARPMQALIKLARMAAEGSFAHRGGSDHEGVSFTLRNCMLFSSILIPPLLPQDRSRMAILELDALAADATPPPITERKMGELGTRLRRRLMDQWPRWAGTVDAYRGAMRRGGHSARGQDVFGTLLACADLLLYDQPPDEAGLTAWQQKLAAGSLAELMGDVSDEKACLIHLLSTVAELPHDRRRNTLGRWVGIAAGHFEDGNADLANRLLCEHGLKVVSHFLKKYLAVANTHRGLERIFDGTQWAGKPGTQGGWVQALQRLPHLVPLGETGKPKALWFGVAAKGFYLPIALCLPERDALDTDGPAGGGGAGAGLRQAAGDQPAATPADASASLPLDD